MLLMLQIRMVKRRRIDVLHVARKLDLQVLNAAVVDYTVLFTDIPTNMNVHSITVSWGLKRSDVITQSSLVRKFKRFEIPLIDNSPCPHNPFLYQVISFFCT